MYDVPEGYGDAVTALDRTVDIFISIGTGIDNTAADDLTVVSADLLPMSNKGQVTDAIYELSEGLATFEGDGIPTALSADMRVPPLSPVKYPPEVGLWSSAISDAEGNIDQTFVLDFSASHNSALRIYTGGPNILQATATYSDGTVEEFIPSLGYITVTNEHTYDSISIHITKLDASFKHVRLVEFEFGASVTLACSLISGEVTFIEESDPLEQSIPLSELDLSIINVDGDFDIDNPDGRSGEVAIGFPILLSYTVNGANGSRYTVPCGRFFIGERSSADTTLTLTAFDGRWLLSRIYRSWTVPSDRSFGETLEDLFGEYNVPHLVDTALYSAYPDGAYSFDDTTSILEDLLTIQQAYAIYCVPDKDGTIHITNVWPSDMYGPMAVPTMISWPSPVRATRYNHVSVGYLTMVDGAQVTTYVERDLRTDPSEGRSTLQVSGNGMITTEARAMMFLDRLVSHIYAESVEAECMGDPAMDMGDSVGIPGRWTQDDPVTYLLTYKEMVYDGALRATVRGTRQ